ncbi:hypothetical protein BT96DRAFT_416877 [Gymnopus androsaceus JB14]|uniref:CCHC-type domain-containing protein n=1 Tax=Gymnopus androsaceus JB14 TaxID=1447944 RepID=A0A6A4GU98_9AGAR|nr:hypothetical protein BT96DRAFT_416877 [Gymnopus androsaceus JB14]
MAQHCAFVTFFNEDDAKACIAKLHRSTFKDKKIVAEFGRQTSAAQSVTCYRCGAPGHRASECAAIPAETERAKCFHCGSLDQYETVYLGRLPECNREEISRLCLQAGIDRRIASTRLLRERRAFLCYNIDDAYVLHRQAS